MRIKKRFGNVNYKTCFYLINILLILVTCYSTKIISSSNKYDLKLTIVDQSQDERPITGANVMIFGTLPDWYGGNFTSLLTSPGGYAAILSVPEGMKNITITWKSRYNPNQVVIFSGNINLFKTTDIKIKTTVYDAELRFITQEGQPIIGAEVRLAGVLLGLTNENGEVFATQVPSTYTQTSQPYPVKVTQLGVDISPDDVIIEATKTYNLTAKNVGPLVVQVVGAQGQGLNTAQVDITKEGLAEPVFSGVSNEQGIVSIVVPFGTYYINANYKDFLTWASTTVNSSTGTVQTLTTNVYIEVLGIAMSYTVYIWIQVLIILVIVATIIICLSIIFKRR